MSWKIYKRTAPNGKCYIGLTRRTLEERSGPQGKEYGRTSKFARAIEKYGWENFTHEILEDNITSLEEAKLREIYWVNYFDSYHNGYNGTEGGDLIKGKFLLTGPIYQLDLDLKIINTFNSFKEAAEELNCSARSINECVRGEQIMAAGYYWCKVSDYTPQWSPLKDRRAKQIICVTTKEIFLNQTEAHKKYPHISQVSISYCCLRQAITAGGMYWAFLEDYDENWKPLEAVPKDYSTCKRPIICVSTNIIYESINDVVESLGISRTSIERACKSHHRVCGVHLAFLDEYSENWIPIEYKRKTRGKKIYCIETDATFESIRQASKELNISTAMISHCCNNQLPTAKGYHFKYL